MPYHWTQVAGIATTIAGWVWLIFFTGVSSSRFDDSVFNLHMGTMAGQLCMLGYTLIIVGTLIACCEWILDGLRELRPPRAGTPPASSSSHRSVFDNTDGYRMRNLD